uniref:Succinate dehydrogenase cytochrome b560 subunit n=1 Tax=Porphyra purpurea TaxID=2787 RepID=C560_PORPU|nr:succinate:cytochrome c oxidoreductase subunit 3 [Porphyra purpurea]P80478.1 RecName: Full=Succinate dehydrogenase cytochrome b560 subunit; AltName: Full=Succinate dehydrogenase, subunit III [Porphyra purpurea]AAD03124.1 succinate:cytochrome c oxidoreductase subunit 3 [Porphyra purpurea]
MYNINRPISPHLTIYNTQKSSLFSIWHRISGVAMFTLIASPPLFLKLATFSYKSFNILDLMLNNSSLILPWFIVIISVIFLYHIINGIRHFLWDSVVNVNTESIIKDSNTLLALVFLIMLFKFIL